EQDFPGLQRRGALRLAKGGVGCQLLPLCQPGYALSEANSKVRVVTELYGSQRKQTDDAGLAGAIAGQRKRRAGFGGPKLAALLRPAAALVPRSIASGKRALQHAVPVAGHRSA